MSEKNLNEDEMVLCVGAGYKQPIRPHMQFEYPDPEIQEDLYQLMKYSCGEVCTPEQRDKVMKIWTTFIEQVLGVPPHPPSSEGKEDGFKAKNHTAKSVDDITEKNGSPVDEAAHCKTSDLSKARDERLPTEHPCSSRVRTAHGNYGVNADGSPAADNVASKSETLCSAPQNRHIQTDANMMSAKSWASKQAGFLEEVAPNAAGQKSINDENASATWKGPDYATADCGIEAMASQKSQDGVIAKPTSSSIGTVPEEVRAQKCHEEIIARTKSEREEGELSPNRNLEENSFAAFENTGTKTEQTPRKSTPRTTVIGGEGMSVEEVGEETDAIADDEGEESAQGSSDSENASENVDVSASESANGEEGSPEEPDDDGDHENDHKAESEGEADGVADVHDAEGMMAVSDRFLQTVKPLTMNVPMALHGKEKNSQIFYGNDSFYLLFRLHQMLYERMHSAKLHASSHENKWKILNDAKPTDSYARFKDALHSLLNGSSDNAKFEDECRAIIGAQSYILFTLDKLIHKLVKQLQTIATEEIDNKLLQLYAYERSRNPETFADAVYLENARFLLPEDNLYRIECLPSPMRLTIQLMKNEHDKLEPTAVSMDPNFAAYLNDELLRSVVRERKDKPGVFLKRNKRKFSTGDEITDTCKAMEGLIIRNGVEMKVNCSTFKAAYVLDTEDFLYRKRSRRRNLYHNSGPSGATSGTCSRSSHRAKRCKLFT
ncbi:UNVERIFIED_CONTAM: Paired amphipathic helix protein Sin3-like 3 [Sesamum radiatum]|uniref:Paired amphipathic helix protein Sin3-like 3 n=1 Tax=Sesamum radiatum TaxID=300843 RepID=A0AAW2MZ67_SESRA